MSMQLEITQVTIGPPWPTDPSKMTESVVLRVYRDGLDTIAAQGCQDEVLVEELAA